MGQRLTCVDPSDVEGHHSSRLVKDAGECERVNLRVRACTKEQ